MKKPLFATLLALCLMSFSSFAGPRDIQWRAVDEAVRKGLPKSAIEALDPIISGALADQAYPEAIRAIGRKIVLEGTIEGNKPEEKIMRLEFEVAKAPPAMKPLMEAILGHWYWHYFQQNRWRFMQRTQTAAEPGSDIQTWDLARILAEIDRHFTAALADEQALRATPIAEYDGLLERGTASDLYRPTLWDFLAYEALEFYQAGEQGALQAEDTFELDAVASPIFGPAAEFAAWQPPSGDASSPILRAVQLFQKLLRAHAAEADRAAYLDADLARLRFGSNHATGEDKDTRYKAALERLAAEAAGHEIEGRVLLSLAYVLHGEGDLVRAHELARRIVARDRHTYAAAESENLIGQIEAKSARIETEGVWDAAAEITVHYRNVAQVYFRAVPLEFESYLRRSRWGLGNFDGDRRRELRAAEPALAWSADLPATADFAERAHGVAVPRGLRPGFYGVLASHDAAFDEDDNQLSVAYVWVSELALVTQTRTDGSPLRGFVLEAQSGEPVTGAQVQVWSRDREGRYRPQGRVATDREGRFDWASGGDGLILVAEHAGRAVSSASEVWARDGRDPERTDTQTVFFTDRALYRPGQSIHYKGVSVRYDQKAAKYSALDRLDLTVVFKDPNGKEIARATHRTNEYGSFSGVFTAPRDRLMGRMSIQVLNRPSSVSFSVEEYKRPKFQVELEAPDEAPRLGAAVVLKGTATAYTGASIGGAAVAWRVERSVRLPGWCWWWQPPASKAVAHGRAVTAADGTFEVRFEAVPDRSVPEKNEPVFTYTLHADVTDTTGETRSSERAVRAGYTALAASLATDEWQVPDKPVVISLRTTSLDGEPQAAEGTLTIHALVQPERVQRTPLQRERFWWRSGDEEPPIDPSNPDSWTLGAKAATLPFETGATGVAKLEARLQPGIYRASLETKDRFGKPVTARQTIRVVDPAARALPVKVAQVVAAPTWTVEPGQDLTVLWGTGYESGRAYVELECDGRMIRSGWTEAGRTQAVIEQKITEEMRGGLTLRLTYVRENRAYLVQRVIDVPWSNKQLTVKWESFRSKLEPGAKETWTAIVGGPDAERASAEMVAALYDASLDQYLAHSWAQAFSVFRREFVRSQMSFQNQRLDFRVLENRWYQQTRAAVWTYRSFPAELTTNMRFYEFEKGMMARAMPAAAASAPGAEGMEVVTLQEFSIAGARQGTAMALAEDRADFVAADAFGDIGGEAARKFKEVLEKPAADLTQVTARRNLNETAFFFPHLTSGQDGTVRMTFTMPEALTEWRFLGFAHDAQLRAGYLEGRAVTAKDLMVEPNPPRFVREGDAIEFTVKVSNQSDAPQTGRVKLTFADAATLAPVDAALGNDSAERAFDVPAKQSRSYSWRVTVPDGMGFLTCKAVGASASVSDGEEGFLPVLSRRILVTESLPLPVRGKGTREFELKKLVESGGSTTLRHQSLTVQMVSQPAWYAVMALPYLMEYPYECSEQIFNRYYANTLARHIAGSDPKIRRIFDLWKNTPALDSPLEKSQDLKSVMLEETPWLRDGAGESQARRNVGLLFDDNRLDEDATRTLQKLAERQLEDGLWPWFPGGRPSEYISLYITTGFGRLRQLGAAIDVAPAVRALSGLDAWMDRRYRDIRPEHRDDYVPAHVDCIYLYGRSFFLRDQPIDGAHREAVEYFQRQAGRHWLKTDCRMCQAQAAIALQRFGDTETPRAILRSLQERSVSNDELGMFWRDTEASWWWYRAPIETQATMIEAFAEVAQDAVAVEAMQVWLLKQKQTQDWKTTKATADAVYALLLRGRNLLASDALVEVALGGETIKPEKVEAGTGFYEQKFVRGEIRPEMGRVTVTKTDEGVSWGSVHWQYLEDMAKVTPHEATPLKLKKTLWVKETTDKGPVLRPVSGAIAVGDELVVRIELRTDRDMEYVHLKDQRGSGTEPVNVLSRFRYQDGLGYYESTRDTASHFFIEYLPKGTYVFEYSTRVQLRGNYQSGIAEIQCMYAPEFNSHSESVVLEVK
ncbi:MAG: hypothetical protein IAE82_19200 [Opitutaceae bacterium]|nr:hypothetical protein [Opitutaceae bacterium]